MPRDLTLIYSARESIFGFSHQLQMSYPCPRGLIPIWVHEEKQMLYRLCEDLLGHHDHDWTTVGIKKFAVGFRNKSDAMKIKLAFVPGEQ